MKGCVYGGGGEGMRDGVLENEVVYPGCHVAGWMIK